MCISSATTLNSETSPTYLGMIAKGKRQQWHQCEGEAPSVDAAEERPEEE
jgi:hypothetical protein